VRQFLVVVLHQRDMFSGPRWGGEAQEDERGQGKGRLERTESRQGRVNGGEKGELERKEARAAYWWIITRPQG